MEIPFLKYFDNPAYYKKPLPVELAASRQWQLVYGEFRAPKYMAVMRHYMANFDWANVKESDVALAMKLLMVWMSMSSNRLREWPTMHEALKTFSNRLVNEYHDLVFRYMPSTKISWIDDDIEWFVNIEEPYEALQR